MNNIYFKGSETSGSVAKVNLAQTRKCAIPEQTPSKDTVSFRGNMDKSDGAESIGKVAAGLVAAAALIIGGLGYAKKADWVSKIKNEKVKNFANKMTEPCYNVCKKTKDFVVKYYEKVKNFFSKKS